LSPAFTLIVGIPKKADESCPSCDLRIIVISDRNHVSTLVLTNLSAEASVSFVPASIDADKVDFSL
jgi:hypothetical protein